MKVKTRRVLFVIGCLLITIWVVATLVQLWRVIDIGCLTGGSADGPPGNEDCGDVRRGRFFISVALAFVTVLPGILMMLPTWIDRRRPRASP